MNKVKFGITDENVSEMCLGTMMFGGRTDEAEADRIVSYALEHGVTFLDTAAMYMEGVTEEILGRILKGKRDQFFIGTKVHIGVDAKSILASIDESLARLQTDYVDLYMIHWPKEGMKPTEVMEALNTIVEQGKVRYVGCCNYSAWLFAHHNAIAERNDWAKLVCNQVPYNLIERGIEVELIPQAVAENVAITVYRALCLGLFAGKYHPDEPLPEDSRGQTDDRVKTWLERYADGLRQFNQFAQDHGLHPAQLAVAWQRHSAGVTCPIVGVSSLAQVQEGIEAFEFDLTTSQYQEITAMFDTEVKEEAGGKFAELRRVAKFLG